MQTQITHHITRHLTHISMASFLWDMGKQNRPRYDAAKRGVPSGAILFAYHTMWKNAIRIKITPDAPKNENMFIQMINMGNSICHKWVKLNEDEN